MENEATSSATLYSIIAKVQSSGLDTERYLTKMFSQSAGIIFRGKLTELKRAGCGDSIVNY